MYNKHQYRSVTKAEVINGVINVHDLLVMNLNLFVLNLLLVILKTKLEGSASFILEFTGKVSNWASLFVYLQGRFNGLIKC